MSVGLKRRAELGEARRRVVEACLTVMRGKVRKGLVYIGTM